MDIGTASLHESYKIYILDQQWHLFGGNACTVGPLENVSIIII